MLPKSYRATGMLPTNHAPDATVPFCQLACSRRRVTDPPRVEMSLGYNDAPNLPSGLVVNNRRRRSALSFGGHRRRYSSSVAKRDFHVAGGLNHLPVRRNQSQPVDCVGDRHMANLIALVAHHRSEMALVGKLHCLHPKTC